MTNTTTTTPDLRTIPEMPACIGDVHYGWEWKIMVDDGNAPADIAVQLDQSRPVHCQPGRRYRLCQNGLGRHYLSNAGRDSNKKG